MNEGVDTNSHYNLRVTELKRAHYIFYKIPCIFSSFMWLFCLIFVVNAAFYLVMESLILVIWCRATSNVNAYGTKVLVSDNLKNALMKCLMNKINTFLLNSVVKYKKVPVNMTVDV